MRMMLALASVLAGALALSGCEGANVGDMVSQAYASVRQAIENRLDGKSPTANSEGRTPRRKGGRPHLVELADVVSQPLHITSVYSGSLRARRVVRVHAQEEGRLSAVGFYEGDGVEAGQQLFAIDDALLRAALSKADAVLAEARANLKRLDGLRQRRMVGEDEFLRAQTAVRVAESEREVLDTRLGYARVAAPFSGVVTERLVEPGDVVARHQHLLTLIDPTALTLDIQAAELLVSRLARGTAVKVRIDALGVSDHPGEVVRVFPEINPRTRQGRIEVGLTPVPDGARPGQFARVTFDLDTFARTVIPFGALRRDRNEEYVFVVNAKNKTRRVAVRSGRRVSDRVEILEGLEPGQQVVLRGFLGLRGGKQVTPVNAEKNS